MSFFRVKFRSVADDGLSVLLLVLLACAALYPAILQHKIPLGIAHVQSYPPWDREAAGGDVVEDAEDARAYSDSAFVSDSLARKDSLLWNPLENAGTPFFASWRTGVLSPFRIPFLFFPLKTALCVAAFAKVLAAGLFAFYAARRLGLQSPTAFLVGAAYQCGASTLLWLGDPVSDVVPWVPLFFLFAERLALGQPVYWPYGALIAAVALFGGAPEAVAGMALYFSCYVMARCLIARSAQVAPSLAALAGALLLAMGLAGVQILPFVELSQNVGASAIAPRAMPGATDFVAVFFPQFLSGSARNVARAGGPFSTRDFAMLHVGLIQVFLAALWCCLRHCVSKPHRQRMDVIFGTTAGFLLAVLLAGPIVHQIPILRLMRAEHFLVVNSFAFAFGGAAAAESWLELNPEQCNSALKRMGFLMPGLFLLAALGVFLAFEGDRGGAPDLLNQVAVLSICALCFFGILAVSLFRPSVRIVGYGLGAVTALQLLWSFSSFMAFTDEADAFPETRAIAAFRDTNARVVGGAALESWPLSGNGVAQLSGATSRPLERYRLFSERAETSPELYRLAGASAYVLNEADLEGPYAPLRPLFRVEEVFSSAAAVFSNISPVERVRLVTKVRVVDRFDPRALSADAPPLVEGLDYLSAAEASGPVVIASSSNRQVRVGLEDCRGGLLVLADAYYPGWEALVDGVEAVVLPVNGAFRGVVVPEGAREVVFQYAPASFRAGMAVTAASALVVGAGLINLLIYRSGRRRRAV